MHFIVLQCPTCEIKKHIDEDTLDPDGDWPLCSGCRVPMLPIGSRRVVHHLDGNPNNHAIENLRIVNPPEK